MAQILIGQFDDFDSAETASQELRSLGVAQGDMEIFALNAPGQHDQYPIGGDEDADRGARKGDEGAVAGAAIGGVAGLALGAVAIPGGRVRSPPRRGLPWAPTPARCTGP